MSETSVPNVPSTPAPPAASGPSAGHPPVRPRLTRPRSGRVLGGVCAGIALQLGWRPGRVRLLAVLSCLLPGPQFIGYLVLWLALPDSTT